MAYSLNKAKRKKQMIEVLNHIERTYLSAFEAANTINHLLYENNHNINLSLIRKHYERL